MSDKIREALEEAQGVIASNRLVLGEYMGVRYISELEHKIKQVLAEPVDLTYSQEDVNKKTSEMIALRKDYEKLAYQRGAEAMREDAAKDCIKFWGVGHTSGEMQAGRIRELPLPDDK